MMLPAGQLKQLLLEKYQNRRSMDPPGGEEAGWINSADLNTMPLCFPGSPSVSPDPSQASLRTTETL